LPTALDTILGAARLADATSAFRAALTPLGIDTFSAGEVDTAHRSRVVFAVVDWPESWQRFYFSSSLLQRDPVVENLGLYGGRPFTWAELRADRRLAQVGTEALDLIAEAGWRDGLVVPLHRAGTHYGIVSAVARDIIPDAHRQVMVPLCLAFHSVIGPLARQDGFAMPPAGLTPREIDALALIVKGKSDRQIGEALGISMSTAHEHVERAKRRLATHTRAELAAVAVALGIVSM
jgi:LuxR family transcriptional regulator, quorum-sensing system regulator BjaR1